MIVLMLNYFGILGTLSNTFNYFHEQIFSFQIKNNLCVIREDWEYNILDKHTLKIVIIVLIITRIFFVQQKYLHI